MKFKVWVKGTLLSNQYRPSFFFHSIYFPFAIHFMAIKRVPFVLSIIWLVSTSSISRGIISTKFCNIKMKFCKHIYEIVVLATKIFSNINNNRRKLRKKNTGKNMSLSNCLLNKWKNWTMNMNNSCIRIDQKSIVENVYKNSGIV